MPLSQLMNAVVAQGQTPGAGSGWMDFLPFVLIIFIFYFLLIRPQQKRAKEQQSLIASLKRDDEVVTSGEIFGKITNLTEQVATIEISPNVRIKIQRAQIAGIRASENASKDSKEAKESPKESK